jgi:hypothetical protein
MKTTVAGGFGRYAELLPAASEIVRTPDQCHGASNSLEIHHATFLIDFARRAFGFAPVSR